MVQNWAVSNQPLFLVMVTNRGLEEASAVNWSNLYLALAKGSYHYCGIFRCYILSGCNGKFGATDVTLVPSRTTTTRRH